MKKIFCLTALAVLIFAGCQTGGQLGSGPDELQLDNTQSGTSFGPTEGTVEGGAAGTDTGASEFTLNVELPGIVKGLVKTSDAGIFCGVDFDNVVHHECSKTYPAGTIVELSAKNTVADTTFGGWSELSCAGNPNCAVTMAADKNIYAVFKKTTPPAPGNYVLSVKIPPPAYGMVMSDPVGIECGTLSSGEEKADCVKDFPAGTTVKLRAKEPIPGNVFSQWILPSDIPVCHGIYCDIDMTKDITVEAYFKSIGPNLVVVVKKVDDGRVLSYDGGIACGKMEDGTVGIKCISAYPVNTAVKLVPKPTTIFNGWTGDCFARSSCALFDVPSSGLEVKLSNDETVNAEFR